MEGRLCNTGSIGIRAVLPVLKAVQPSTNRTGIQASRSSDTCKEPEPSWTGRDIQYSSEARL